MIIYLGSTRPAKVEGAREALAAIGGVDPRFAAADVRTLDLGARGAGDADVRGGDRRGRADSRAGARRRGVARGAAVLRGRARGRARPGRASAATRSGCSGRWACVTDGSRWGYGAGGVAPIPTALAEGVLAGRELGELVDALAGPGTRSGRGAWGVLTRDLISRRDAFRIAVLAAFAPFYNAAAYAASQPHPDSTPNVNTR